MTQRKENQEVIQEWRRRRGREFLNVVPALIALVVFGWIAKTLRFSFAGVPSFIFAASALGVISASFVFAWFNWRCPACGKLPGHVLNPRFCSQCGVPLR